MTAATPNVCFPLKANDDHPWQTGPPSCSHARMSPHNPFLILPPSLLGIVVSVWVHPPSVIAPLCHHLPPRPVPDSDERWRGGRNESTWLKYGSNYKQKDVRKGWPVEAHCCREAVETLVGSSWVKHELGMRQLMVEYEASASWRSRAKKRSWNNRAFEVRKSNCWRDREIRRGRVNHHLCFHRLHERFFYFALFYNFWP